MTFRAKNFIAEFRRAMQAAARRHLSRPESRMWQHKFKKKPLRRKPRYICEDPRLLVLLAGAEQPAE